MSLITNMPPNLTIYSEGKHNATIDKLIASATDKALLSESKNDLDALFTLAKNNDQDSIELLQNLSLSDGEIASYSQDLLCKLIAKEDGSSYEAACSARSGCQNLIMNFSSNIITNKTLEENPKLLLIAGSKIEGDAPYQEPIPLQIKSKIISFDNKDVKPQWWHETKLKDGQFETPKPSNIENKSYLVKEHKLPDDGACQFRAVFTLRDKHDKWLSASKEDIRTEIEKDPKSVKDAIRDSANFLKDCNLIPNQFKEFFYKDNFEGLIYDKTIKSGDFNLYSPVGIESALGIESSAELTTEERRFILNTGLLGKKADEENFLLTFADSIGEKLKEVFKLPLSSDESKAYAVPTGNHYNLITPVDFFKNID